MGAIRYDGPRGCGLVALSGWNDDRQTGSIWTLRPDGVERRLLVEGPSVYHPVWSPDARHVGFEAADKHGDEWLHVMEPDGAHETRIARLPDNAVWDWAPGGRRIVAAAGSWGLLRPIYVMGLDGTRRWMTLGKAPAWSPDGSQIAYGAGRIGRGGGGLFTIDVRTKAVRQLTFPVDASDSSPTWSPDGHTILFLRYPSNQHNEDGPYADAWSLDLDTMLTTQVTHQQDDLNGIEAPAWSPRGDHISFEDVADDYEQAVVSRPDGTDEWRIPTGHSESSDADWSPDGESIVFDGYGGIRVITVRAGRSRRLLDDVPMYWDQPDWAPC